MLRWFGLRQIGEKEIFLHELKIAIEEVVK